MRLFSIGRLALSFFIAGVFTLPLASQANSAIALHASSTMNVVSEAGGAFMSSSKCDADGNLYIRKYAVDRPLLGPVVKIDPDGKRVALFDPASFSELGLDRADAFSPASDGGIYQIAQSGVLMPHIYALRFSSDGTPSTPTLLGADLEVYAFAAFAGGNFLVSGVKRDVQNPKDRGRNFTAVFAADGRELAQLTFPEPSAKAGAKSGAGDRRTDRQKDPGTDSDKAAPALDLADAEVGSDGNLYVMRAGSPALIYVITPSGKIMRTIKVAVAAAPSGFHVSGNRLAISYWNEAGASLNVAVVDAQTGRKIDTFSDPEGLGPSFACYSANDGVFTFLKLGEKNEMEVIHAEAQ
jgi:hypothetical protein